MSTRTLPCPRRVRGHLRLRDEGAAAVVLVLLTPALLAVAGLVLDGGTALAARQRTADLAEQAARAGADRLDTNALRASGTSSRGALDPTAARAAACRYVHSIEPFASCTATVLPATGGSAQQLRVRIRTSTPTTLLGLIGVNNLHTDATATAQAITGIRTASLPPASPPPSPVAALDNNVTGSAEGMT